MTQHPVSYRKQPKSLTVLGIILVIAGVLGLITAKNDGDSDKSVISQTSQSAPENNLSNVALGSKAGRKSCKVLTVYDGDTIGCDLNQDKRIEKPEEEIRLLGIDTPEMHYSKKNKNRNKTHITDEPFAKEASELVTRLALHQTAYLTFDEERYDKYGRTLAYVSLDPRTEASLCELLLRKGYAKTLFIPPNFQLETDFRIAENSAKEKQLAIWGKQ